MKKITYICDRCNSEIKETERSAEITLRCTSFKNYDSYRLGFPDADVATLCELCSDSMKAWWKQTKCVHDSVIGSYRTIRDTFCKEKWYAGCVLETLDDGSYAITVDVNDEGRLTNMPPNQINGISVFLRRREQQ